MESGRIANEQISASSTFSDGRWTPQQSRLHGDDNGWTPNLDSNKEYLQVLTQILVCVCVCVVGERECDVWVGGTVLWPPQLESKEDAKT